MPRKKEDPYWRFWLKVSPSPSGCWLWTGAVLNTGYASFSDENRRTALAHRWAYRQAHGEIPPGLVLDHVCRVRHCVNPEHLEPVTHSENLLRGDTLNARNAAKTHCVNGHPFTEANTFPRRLRRSVARGCRQCKSGRVSYA